MIWIALLAGILGAWVPLNFSAELALTLPSIGMRGAVAVIELTAHGAATALSVAAGYALWLRRPHGPMLYLVDGIEVRLGPDAWSDRLARLDGVLAELDASGERVASIDLRFRDQVVLAPRVPPASAVPSRAARFPSAGLSQSRIRRSFMRKSAWVIDGWNPISGSPSALPNTAM